MFTENLDAFLSPDDFAVPVIMGAVETTGLEEFADQALLGDEGRGEVLGRLRSVIVPTAAVVDADLGEEDPIVVNGTTYRAGIAEAVEDGAFTRIPLGDVAP
jgi:hypothetical protein